MRRDHRCLTDGEQALARGLFGTAIDYPSVRIVLGKWFPFQPRSALMAPCGHIHAHPRGHLWSEDYSSDAIGMQALFAHEMTHIWQAQTRGRYYLPLMRHPFCRYRYTLKPGRRFEDYGLEQQAEIVRHVYLMRAGRTVIGAPALAELEAILPFETGFQCAGRTA
ncbi:MAG TPA: vgr related protein [Allosphingosinicella sp.]|nr:vgr related protein [Allosphingosinicella sp.]